MAALAHTFLREVPEHLVKGVVTGEYTVTGSILRAASGQIVGHLQETGSFSSIVSVLINGGGVPGPMLAIKSADAALRVVNTIQNEQIKAGIAIVQSLQVATLAASGLSIGVSVAGAAILHKQIAKVERKINEIEAGLELLTKKIEELRSQPIADDFLNLRTLADQVEDAWLPSATQSEWIDIARACHFLGDRFEFRARALHDTSDALAADAFVEAFSLVSGMRVTARLAAGQDDMARKVAKERAQTLCSLGQPIQINKLVFADMAKRDDAATAQWQEQLEQNMEQVRSNVAVIREREIAAAASSETLEALARKGISGRNWLEAARAENENPLLFLPVE